MSRIVGLDLGSYSVKVVRVEARRVGEFEVLSYDEEVLPPLEEGLSLRDRQKSALVALKERGRLEGDVFVTGLVGDVATLRTLVFPFSDPKKIEAALPFQLEAEIPFDLDEVVVAWTVIGPKWSARIDTEAAEREKTEKPERKASGETEVLVCSARREVVADLLALLAEVHIDPRHVELDALALDDLYDGVFRAAHEASEATALPRTPGGTVIETGPDFATPAVAMVDIGHKRTSVCITAGDHVVSAHTILHGGFDATRALSREIGISIDDAERGKRKEAFIEVTGATAQFPEQRRISDVLKQAYAPVVRRLRQTFQSGMVSARVRVTKVILTGGGSRILNLDRHLAEELNVRVERGRDLATRLSSALPVAVDAEARAALGDVPEAAGALGYALSGLYGTKTRARIDFRTAEFAWKGDFDFVRERAAAIGIWLVVIVLVLGASSVVRSMLLGQQEDALVAKQVAVCKSITGQDIQSSSQCLAIIQERISGQAGFKLPEDSSVDMYMELARRLPKKDVLYRKVTELEISDDRVRIKGMTTDYDAVDKIVAALQDGRCFTQVEKGKARNVKDQVEFNVTLKLDCAVNPGKPIEGETTTSGASDYATVPAARPTPTPALQNDGAEQTGVKTPEERRLEREERIRAARERLGRTNDNNRIPSSVRSGFPRPGVTERDAAVPSVVGADGVDIAEKRREKLEQIRSQKETFERLREKGELEQMGPRVPGRPGDPMRPMPAEGGRRPLPIPAKGDDDGE
jgi:general secretion pathway protein L